ncbi:MAG: hypothetical protein JWN03_7431 [Nocardia sp.]|uniref:hypothetical protein n=1 Tax=Nocardia sp. TaxID=1821 RepID=UPI0026081372|nr:hypothetical protein [Nocardia sp.]MCU1647156.1 hypothetical protein [Nocardia sp.]
MTTTCALEPSSQTSRRRIPVWDRVITGVCLVLAFVTAIWLTMLTGMLAMAGDPCAPDSPCTDQVGHGITVSLLGMLAVLVIGLGCVIIAAITRTRLFIWALATLLLLPVPVVIGSNIADHASQLSTVGPSHP